MKIFIVDINSASKDEPISLKGVGIKKNKSKLTLTKCK